MILVIGENELVGRESWGANHVGDRASLGLPGRQQELADAIFDLNKPVIVYLMNGRPLAIPAVVERASAVFEGWYAGQETGSALADLLFGRVNPSAKLTITIPRQIGQLPMYYNYKPSARRFSYVDLKDGPLFPFGFGLSYTTYKYGAVTLAQAEVARNGVARVTLDVTNEGPFPGEEIVQLYVSQKVCAVTRPVRELKSFRRIAVAPGATTKVTFQLLAQELRAL